MTHVTFISGGISCRLPSNLWELASECGGRHSPGKPRYRWQFSLPQYSLFLHKKRAQHYRQQSLGITG